MPCLVLMLSMPLLAAAPAPAWEYLSSVGPLQIVYVAPSRINDSKLLVEAVSGVFRKVGVEHPIQIDFFDDRELAPARPPYTLEQKRHLKAKFNFNPKNGLRRFVRLELVPDPDYAGRSKLKETVEDLPLPWPPS